jgi:hypothetical protein
MSLVGKKFRAVINGRSYLNGAPYSLTIDGDVAETTGEATIYDAMRFLTYHIERESEEMELPTSIELAIADSFEDDTD